MSERDLCGSALLRDPCLAAGLPASENFPTRTAPRAAADRTSGAPGRDAHELDLGEERRVRDEAEDGVVVDAEMGHADSGFEE